MVRKRVESLFRMAYGDESLCERSNCDCKKAMLRKTKKRVYFGWLMEMSLREKSNCDGKKAILRKTKKKNKKTNNIFNIFRVSTPT